MDLHQRLISLPKHAVIICEAEQTERLSNLIVDSWQDSQAPALAEKLSHSDRGIDDSVPSEFADLQLNDVEGKSVAVEDVAWLVPNQRLS